MKRTQINIRVTKKDKKKIENNAEKKGLSVSSFLRMLGLKGVKNG